MKVFALVCAAVLCACSTDVFVDQDGGNSADASIDSAPNDSSSKEAAIDADAMILPSEGGSGGDAAAHPTKVQCNGGVECDNQLCCTTVLWSTSTCHPNSDGTQAACTDSLACDDPSDCTGAQVCCAHTYLGAVTKSVCVSSSACNSTGDVVLCTDGGQCATPLTCQPYSGNPTWLKNCQ